MGWRVALSDEAEDDLGNVVRFLAQKNPAAAERIGRGVGRSDLLARSPAESRRTGKRRPGLRKIAYRHCLIIYRPNEHALVLGAGFGGLELSPMLSEAFGDTASTSR